MPSERMPNTLPDYEAQFALTILEAQRRGLNVADPTPPAGRTCVVNGLDLQVLDWGGGDRPPMLLLHGVLLNAHTWDFFSLQVRDSFHVYSVDLPGHGDSAWIADGDYSRARICEHIVGLIEQLDLRSMLLVGHSFGGSIAALVAARVPDRVRALVLVDSTLLPTGRGGSSVVSRALAGPPSFATFVEFADYAARLGGRRDPSRPPVSLAWNARRLADGRWTWKYDPTLRRRSPGRTPGDFDTIWAALQSLTCPALFVRAGKDSHLSDEAARRLQALPTMRMEVVPDAGHNVMVENPSGFGRAVGEFLAGLDLANRA